MLQTREMSEWVVHNILRTPFYAEGITPTRETRVRMKIISPAIKTFYMTHVKTKRPSLSCLYLSLLIVLLSSRLRAKCLMLENPAFLITSTRTVQLVFPSFFLSDMTVYTAHDGINIKKKTNCFTTNCLFTRKICCITKIMNQK